MSYGKGGRPRVGKRTIIKTPAPKPKPTPTPPKARITEASKSELTEEQKEEIKKKEVTDSILSLIRYETKFRSGNVVYDLKPTVDFNKVVIELCKLDFLSVKERNEFINNFNFNKTSIRDFNNAKSKYTAEVFPLIQHALFVANYVIDGYNKKIDILNRLNIPGIGNQLSRIGVAESSDKNYESTDVVLNLDDISKNEYGKVIIPNSVSNGINTKINLKKVSPQKTDLNGNDLFQKIGEKINDNLKKFIVENLLNYNKDNKNIESTDAVKTVEERNFKEGTNTKSIDDCSYNYAIQDIKNLLKEGSSTSLTHARILVRRLIYEKKILSLISVATP